MQSPSLLTALLILVSGLIGVVLLLLALGDSLRHRPAGAAP
jgi:hypothetical protein